MMRRIAVLAVLTLACAAPATAEEVSVGVGPVGVTVGSNPDRVVHEREVIREREPRHEREVVIKKERDPDVVVEKKTIIHRD